MRIDGKNRWLFKLDHNTFYNQKVITNVNYEDEWLKIMPNGEIMIKASKIRPYMFDGCTPKFSICDIVIGTPDGDGALGAWGQFRHKG